MLRLNSHGQRRAHLRVPVVVAVSVADEHWLKVVQELSLTVSPEVVVLLPGAAVHKHSDGVSLWKALQESMGQLALEWSGAIRWSSL